MIGQFFLDISQAFEQVCQEGLVIKLKRKNFQSQTVKLILKNLIKLMQVCSKEV